MQERRVYLDRQGNPIGLLTWAQYSAHLEYRRLKETILPNGRWVSTVWTGLPTIEADPEGGWNGAPMIFRAKVFDRKWAFGEDNEVLDEDEYPTEKAALEGHERLVEKWNDDSGL